MKIIELSQATGSLWHQAMTLYKATFPEWEREPQSSIAQAVNSKDSRLVVITKDNQVVGASITELYPEHHFALLGYLFIAPTWQRKGLGQQLCQDIFKFYQADSCYQWLLVEAEPEPKTFYQQIGFSSIPINYQSPHYNDNDSTAMALMIHNRQNQTALSKEELLDIVNCLFLNSYQLNSDDPRLQNQIDSILIENNL